MNDCANENNDVNQRINNNKTTAIKYFDYKTKILGRTPNDNDMLQEIFGNFWRSLSYRNLMEQQKIV